MVASGAEERSLAFQDKVNTKQLQPNITDLTQFPSDLFLRNCYYNLDLAPCNFVNGHINDENHILIGIASDEDECGHMVSRQQPSASGVTYARNNKTCWAGTANSIQLADGLRACLFNGRCDFIFEK